MILIHISLRMNNVELFCFILFVFLFLEHKKYYWKVEEKGAGIPQCGEELSIGLNMLNILLCPLAIYMSPLEKHLS